MNEPKEDELKLPNGWMRIFSKSAGRHYYSHVETKHTQWHFPTASEAHNPTLAKERALKNEQEEARKQKERERDTGTKQEIVNFEVIDDDSKLKRRREESSLVPNVSHYLQNIHAQSNNQKHTKRLKNDAISNQDPASLNYAATCIAIIVPYRDIHPEQNRAQHLAKFIPHMHMFLKKQMHQGHILDYHIYIIEQSNDGRKFNRGKLLNIGFDLARKNKGRSGLHEHPSSLPDEKKSLAHPLPAHDVFIFHDVDLLPNDDLSLYYTKFPSSPTHIARVWDRYSNNPKYFGGIVAFSSSDMKRINGYPNNFWGWGGEDDEMQKRCEALGIKWDFPSKGTIIDLENMDLNRKLDVLRSNKSWKCMNKWEALEEHEKTWKTNGLSDLSYSILHMKDLDEDRKSTERSRATLISVDVKLNGQHWTNKKCAIDYVES